ncbi:MAG: hypothetical protein QXV83_01660 [Candidatus Anstonellaceae archaeon]
MEKSKYNVLEFDKKNKIVQMIEEDFFSIINFIYFFGIIFLLILNPYFSFYKETDFSKFYYLKDGQKIKVCGEIKKVEKLEKYFLMRICEKEKCFNAHLSYKNEFYDFKTLKEGKLVCLYGEAKRFYNSFYLKVHNMVERNKSK